MSHVSMNVFELVQHGKSFEGEMDIPLRQFLRDANAFMRRRGFFISDIKDLQRGDFISIWYTF